MTIANPTRTAEIWHEDKLYTFERGSSDTVFLTVFRKVTKGRIFRRTKLVYEYMQIIPKGMKLLPHYPTRVYQKLVKWVKPKV